MIRSVGTVGGMTLTSRVTGLIRDIAFAQFLGSGPIADAFFVAFRIPNFFRRIFGEGALSAAFVPVYSEYESRYPEREVKAFLSLMAGRLGLILTLFTFFGVLFAPQLIHLIAPGFAAEPLKFDAAVTTLRLAFPYLFFISLVALAAGILNTHSRFAVAAVTPVLLNLCLIATVWLWVPTSENPAMALGGGVLLAGFIQFGFQLPFLRRLGRLPRPTLRARSSEEGLAEAGVSQVFRLMLPAIFGVSIAQINLLVNTILASFLVTGSVSWLYYSDRLMEFPLGVFGVALATVILPSLSRDVAEGNDTKYGMTLDWALRLVFLICVPATIGLVTLAVPLIATLFQYGAFSADDVEMASRSLVAFAIGLPAFVLIKVLAPGFYARKDTRTPVVIGAIAMAVNVVVALLLVWSMAHTGLALATSISGAVNATLLYIYLRQRTGFRLASGWISFISRVGIAGGVMALALYGAVPEFAVWTSANGAWRVSQLAVWIVAGGASYFAALYLMGVRAHQLIERPVS